MKDAEVVTAKTWAEGYGLGQKHAREDLGKRIAELESTLCWVREFMISGMELDEEEHDIFDARIDEALNWDQDNLALVCALSEEGSQLIAKAREDLKDAQELLKDCSECEEMYCKGCVK